jgi:hypothetical protein
MLIGQWPGTVPFGAIWPDMGTVVDMEQALSHSVVIRHHVDHIVSAPPSLGLHPSIKRAPNKLSLPSPCFCEAGSRRQHERTASTIDNEGHSQRLQK